jgi:hypothetical protein
VPLLPPYLQVFLISTPAIPLGKGKGKGKDKVHPKTGHESPEGE